MNIILITTLVIAVIGVCVGAGLVFTGKKFAVEVDEREVAVREKLPGNNCGACGYAGCDALAGAIARGEAPVNACPVGGAPVAQDIGDIMGITAGAMERKVAFVACKGNCGVTKNQGNYIGIKDCRTAVLSGMNITDCTYGCLGFGSCAEVCPEQAIPIRDGVAVRKVCSAGCIGCGLCVKQCESDAIVFDGTLARIDPEKCTLCGKCAEKCPAKVIMTTPM